MCVLVHINWLKTSISYFILSCYNFWLFQIFHCGLRPHFLDLFSRCGYGDHLIFLLLQVMWLWTSLKISPCGTEWGFIGISTQGSCLNVCFISLSFTRSSPERHQSCMNISIFLTFCFVDFLIFAYHIAVKWHSWMTSEYEPLLLAFWIPSELLIHIFVYIILGFLSFFGWFMEISHISR